MVALAGEGGGREGQEQPSGEVGRAAGCAAPVDAPVGGGGLVGGWSFARFGRAVVRAFAVGDEDVVAALFEQLSAGVGRAGRSAGRGLVVQAEVVLAVFGLDACGLGEGEAVDGEPVPDAGDVDVGDARVVLGGGDAMRERLVARGDHQGADRADPAGGVDEVGHAPAGVPVVAGEDAGLPVGAQALDVARALGGRFRRQAGGVGCEQLLLHAQKVGSNTALVGFFGAQRDSGGRGGGDGGEEQGRGDAGVGGFHGFRSGWKPRWYTERRVDWLACKSRGSAAFPWLSNWAR